MAKRRKGGLRLRSLKFRLLCIWLLSLVASLAVAGLLLQLDRQSTRALVQRAEAVVARACDLIEDRYRFFAAGVASLPPTVDDSLRQGLAAAVGLALEHQDGVEGGVWQVGAGPLAYAFPTYEGTGPKTDLPAAERDQIAAANDQAARGGQTADRRSVSAMQTLLLRACPLPGPIPGLTAWTMTRVRTAAAILPLQLGVGVLLALMVVMSALLARTLLVWGRHIRRIEAALGAAGPENITAVPRTGERELDRVIDALNDAGLRLAAARRESDDMAARVGRAERLAGLGRVAAGVAHEIRNPIAAARLQGENALAGDDARRREAIGDMLSQIDRLDLLVGELLAMTQRVEPRPASVEIKEFLAKLILRHRDVAAAKNCRIVANAAPQHAAFDPVVVGRILDNLLANAVRHAPDGGTVMVESRMEGGLLTFVVSDDGAGVNPELADRLFEPFVTSRADGTGLGLAIARELADAHGGRLVLQRPGGMRVGEGAAFAFELPQGIS
jgi:signal transduction histidine kinase